MIGKMVVCLSVFQVIDLTIVTNKTALMSLIKVHLMAMAVSMNKDVLSNHTSL